MIPTITLANGVHMPQLGFGVFRMKEHTAAYEATLQALQLGYRAIDTAAIYENEEAVGQAIRDSGIAREELFITTKVWNADQGYDETLRAFDVSQKKLGLEYVDLYLTHWPKPQLVHTYRAIERLYDEKLICATGVSNHHEHHLEQIFAVANVAPMVNQIECHPSLSQDALRAFCKEKNIAVTAWAPLGTGIVFTHPIVKQLAAKYGKTPAQIVLRWHIEMGNIAIPKSANKERAAENLRIFDFALQVDEVAALTALNTFHRTGADPDNFDF
ncbi:aldo/keto reductase [Caryophanon latum]|uniref:Glyoxal reductase n=1 Tax=Caryophanon latum TaxID=33977 RepID=A0A1C0YFU1_9BACL|nr:aldo/keto reductase [Caryophanon latum]OCS86027.1 glyoxal reductase [Caryophanon latum]